MYKIVNDVYTYMCISIYFPRSVPFTWTTSMNEGQLSVINQQGRHVVHKKPSVRKESTDEMDEYIMLIVQHE